MAALPLRRFAERITYEPRRQDPYRTTKKPAGTPQCPVCKGFLVKGKWYSEEEARKRLASEKGAISRHSKSMCPACQQSRDRYAMGVVEIHGDSRTERDLIEETVLNTEQVARLRNDQQRILWSHTFRNVTKYYVTLPDLARQIGRVLGRTFKGKAEFHRSTDEPYLRVVWHPEPSVLRPSHERLPMRSSKHWRRRGARVDAAQGAGTTLTRRKGKVGRKS